MTGLNPFAKEFKPETHAYASAQNSCSFKYSNGNSKQNNERKNEMISINIGHININRLRHKTHHLREILTKHSLSVMAITETWLTEDVSNGEIALDGYRLFRRDRRDGQRGGGVCFYVHHMINVKVLSNLDHPDIEMLWLEIKLGEKKATLGCLYRPPSTPVEFWSTLDKVTEEVQGQSIILLGDFNVNSMDSKDTQHKYLKSFCISLELQELVQKPTRITGKSEKCIDLLLTNASNIMSNPTVTHVDFTDHCLVSSAIRILGKKILPQRTATLTRRRWPENISDTNLHDKIQKHMDQLADPDGLDNMWND